MNSTAIIASLIALAAGLGIGTAVQQDKGSSNYMGGQGERGNIEMVAAEDFVSTRPAVDSLPNQSLSQDEIDGLLLMREEEKLARDVYQTLYDTWGIRIFANIAQSEQTHTEAVRDLLEKYNLTDPVTDDTIGVFVNQDMQTLYDSLTEEGKLSEVDALRVGATIEDLDINDLEDLLEQTDNEDITLVYENLARGSRNHLRAFTRQLTNRGETYEPSYITLEEYEAIITSSQETGSGSGGGMGTGGGHNGGGGNRGWGMGGGRMNQ